MGLTQIDNSLFYLYSMRKTQMTTNQIPLEMRRYHSFLNRIMEEFGKASGTAEYKTQKRLLGLALGIVDSFTEIYGDHELKGASSTVSQMLAEIQTLEN